MAVNLSSSNRHRASLPSVATCRRPVVASLPPASSVSLGTDDDASSSVRDGRRPYQRQHQLQVADDRTRQQPEPLHLRDISPVASLSVSAVQPAATRHSVLLQQLNSATKTYTHKLDYHNVNQGYSNISPPLSPEDYSHHNQTGNSAHDTSTGSSMDETSETQTKSARRKNKRKMSEPRRVSDCGVKKFCADEDSIITKTDTDVELSRDQDDSGVETTSAGSAEADRSPVLVDRPGSSGLRSPRLDKSPVDDAPKLPGLPYPPGMIIPAYLPYPYPYMAAIPNTAALSGLNALRLANQSAPKARQTDERAESPPRVQRSDSVCSGEEKTYKSMTVERRIEANARERTRVHTISAAFESLRRAVPAYSYNQKLSKLAILRIACCYILSLSRLADKDYSRDQSRPPFSECVDLTTRTIQSEGRAKKRH